MARTELILHNCTALRLERTFVTNGNSVTLQIEHDGDHVVEITLYDLPAEVTDKLAVLRDDGTSDFTEEEADDDYARAEEDADRKRNAAEDWPE